MSNVDLMQKLGAQMHYLTERQTVLAHNIANIDTPGYRAQDLKKVDFSDMANLEGAKLAMKTTSPGHQLSQRPVPSFRSEENRTGELTPTKNSVELDTEMGKISDTNAQYQISSSLYKKFTTMYRAALGNH